MLSNRSQMTSKCGKNKKVAHEAIAECVTDVPYHILTSSVIYLLNRRTATWDLFVLYNKKHTTSAFYFKIFLKYSKAGLCPLWQTRKKVI